MEPTTGPIIQPTRVTVCLTCEEAPVEPGRLCCDPCVEAARQAIAEAGGQTVCPSDIARVR